MKILRAWILRMAGMFSRKQSESEFADELDSHLQMNIDDNLRAGMTPEQARREALRELGGVATMESDRTRNFPSLTDDMAYITVNNANSKVTRSPYGIAQASAFTCSSCFFLRAMASYQW